MPPNNYSGLKYDLCVDLGMCGGTTDGEFRHIDHYIPDEGQVTADQFVNWVILAEGLDRAPETKGIKRLKARIKSEFVRHLGGEIVEARLLKD